MKKILENQCLVLKLRTILEITSLFIFSNQFLLRLINLGSPSILSGLLVAFLDDPFFARTTLLGFL